MTLITDERDPSADATRSLHQAPDCASSSMQWQNLYDYHDSIKERDNIKVLTFHSPCATPRMKCARLQSWRTRTGRTTTSRKSTAMSHWHCMLITSLDRKGENLY